MQASLIRLLTPKHRISAGGAGPAQFPLRPEGLHRHRAAGSLLGFCFRRKEKEKKKRTKPKHPPKTVAIKNDGLTKNLSAGEENSRTSSTIAAAASSGCSPMGLAGEIPLPRARLPAPGSGTERRARTQTGHGPLAETPQVQPSDSQPVTSPAARGSRGWLQPSRPRRERNRLHRVPPHLSRCRPAPRPRSRSASRRPGARPGCGERAGVGCGERSGRGWEAGAGPGCGAEAAVPTCRERGGAGGRAGPRKSASAAAPLLPSPPSSLSSLLLPSPPSPLSSLLLSFPARPSLPAPRCHRRPMQEGQWGPRPGHPISVPGLGRVRIPLVPSPRWSSVELAAQGATLLFLRKGLEREKK